MDVQTSHLPAAIQWENEKAALVCKGDWSIRGLEHFDPAEGLLDQLPQQLRIDLTGVQHFDSAGALVLFEWVQQLKQRCIQVQHLSFNPMQEKLYMFVAERFEKISIFQAKQIKPSFFYQLGQLSVRKYQEFLAFLEFLGELLLTFFFLCRHPKKIKWSAVFAAIDETGYHALPILGLMSFLIGIVLAYQLAVQLQTYGADIFIVDVSGMAILREFAPLITAIVLAGRTSTAFAALLGTMKVNQEIDVLRVMGILPAERLVFPRLLGLLLAFPLLIVWADVFGILGSMVMANAQLSINYSVFLERLQVNVGLTHYYLGLIKAPVFAAIIAGIGCFQGLQVQNNANSVGERTTRAAVQAIFLIIIADAVFSIIYSLMGL